MTFGLSCFTTTYLDRLFYSGRRFSTNGSNASFEYDYEKNHKRISIIVKLYCKKKNHNKNASSDINLRKINIH